MLRDRLVCGISDDCIQRRLLVERELTFEKVVESATATEMASKNLIDAGRRLARPAVTTISTRAKKKLNLHIFSQNESAIAAVETTIPGAANTRTKCVTNVKRKATWLKYVEERRNLQSKTSMGAGRMANKEPILLKKAPIKRLCHVSPVRRSKEIAQSGSGTLWTEKHEENQHGCFEDDIE